MVFSSQASPPSHLSLSEGIHGRGKTWHFTQLVPLHSKSISVLNHLPTVDTLFLHLPLRSCRPFSCSRSNNKGTQHYASRHPAIPLSCSKPPKHALRNWILWANCNFLTRCLKMVGFCCLSCRALLTLDVQEDKKNISKRCFCGGEERLQKRQGQSKSKLGSTEQTQTVRTQRGRDGCLWSW